MAREMDSELLPDFIPEDALGTVCPGINAMSRISFPSSSASEICLCLSLDQQEVLVMLRDALRFHDSLEIWDSLQALLHPASPAPGLPMQIHGHGLSERYRRGNGLLGTTMADVMKELELLPWGRAPVLTEASPGSTILDGGEDNAHAVDMHGVHAPQQSDQASAAYISEMSSFDGRHMLPAPCYTARAHVLDEGGGRADSIAMGGMHAHGSAASSRYQMVGGMMAPVSYVTEPTGHAVARAEMVTDDMLHAQHSTNGYREGSGSEAHVLDEGGARADSEIVQNYERLYQVPAAVSNLEATGNAVPAQLLIGRRDVEMVTGNMLPAQHYTRAGERGGSQAYVVDEGGGRAIHIAIDVHGPQQNDQASVQAAPATNLTVVEQVLSAVSAGLVLISISNSNYMGDYPEFIKLGLFAACVVLTVSTFVGIMKKKMGKVAMRLLACVSIIAMTTTAVYQVSEKKSIKCIIAVMGGIATMVMGLINWR